MTEFKKIHAEIQRKQEALRQETEAAKQEAIAYIQELVDDFHVQSHEIRFEDDYPTVGRRKPRGKAPIKYRLPNGIEWTGKGNLKKEVKQFLEENGMTRDDLDQFLTEEFKK